jgi:DNA-directed RNA polymerase subunit RPC12/RpoP
MSKLSFSYLCLDCEEVFGLDKQTMSKAPICPMCGNEHNMNLAKVLNRTVDSTSKKEEPKHEQNNSGMFTVDDSAGSVGIGTSAKQAHNPHSDNKVGSNVNETTNSRNQLGEDGKSNRLGISANWIIVRIFDRFDAHRKYRKHKGSVKQRVSGFEANTICSVLRRCKYADRSAHF